MSSNLVNERRATLAGEPAVLIGTIAAAIVAVAALFGIVIDVDTVTGVIVALVPLVSSVLIRSQVSPVVKGSDVSNQ